MYTVSGGARCWWCSWLRHCATSRKVAGSIQDGVNGIYHWHNPSKRTMALGFDSASNRNENQEYFLRGKGGRCIGLTTFISRIVMKSGSLNLLEPSGSVQACNGIALPLFHSFIFNGISVNIQNVPKPMSQTTPGYSPPLIKQKKFLSTWDQKWTGSEISTYVHVRVSFEYHIRCSNESGNEFVSFPQTLRYAP